MANDFIFEGFGSGRFGIARFPRSNWGHNALRVVDHANKQDLIYNMGIFDWSQPGFIYNFMKGLLIYKLGIFGYRGSIQYYKQRERLVVEEKLTLTEMQKRTLLNRLSWQAQPENINYPYHYFYNNCSTKLRDFLDEAVGGQIKQRQTKVFTGTTYRYYVREYLATMPWLASLLDLVMTKEIDHEISVWEDMFTPERMRGYLAEMPAFTDDGKAIPNSKFLADKRVVLQFDSALAGSWQLGYLALCVPLLLLGILGLLFTQTTRFAVFRRSGNRLLGLGLFIWGLFAGLIASGMIIAWVWSHHTTLHGNYNLLLLWPLDFVYASYGARLFFQNERQLAKKAQRTVAWLSLLHLLCAGVWLIGYLSKLVPQELGGVIIYLLPLTLFIWLSTLYHFRAQLIDLKLWRK